MSSRFLMKDVVHSMHAGRRMSTSIRLERIVILTLVVGFLGSPTVKALQSCAIDPDDEGQWGRPYGPLSPMEPSSTQFGNAEIAHSVVLPAPAGEPGLQRVLLLCRTNCAEVYGDEQHAGAVNRSFVWYPARASGAVVELDGPSAGYTGTADTFCSGHVVGADGSVYVVGGLNYVAKCFDESECIQTGTSDDLNTQVGHFRVYKLDTTVDPPEWVSSEYWPSNTWRPHWYPSVTVMHDGRLFVAGHEGAPSPACPVPAWVWTETGTFKISMLYEIFDPELPLSGEAYNFSLEDGDPGNCGDTPTNFDLGVYPRMHLLSTGHLLDTNFALHSLGGPRSLSMNVESPECSGELRWVDMGTQAEVSEHRHGFSSVHFVLQDGVSGVHDVVYDFGGIDGNDANPCPSGSGGTADIFASIEAFDSDTMDWVSMTSLPVGRANQNAVILPTGEILVIGGTSPDCDVVYQCVGYDRATDTWHDRDSLDCPRLYHSTAGLLPDGRVFVAGGVSQTCAGGKNSKHTVEIFSPEYMSSGERPVITAFPNPYASSPDSIEFASNFNVSITLACDSSNTVADVILLRSTSATHAFDMNQRYVQLEINSVQGTYPNFTASVSAPADGFEAPPGFYLLFVIDSNGLPSEGRWVLLE